MTAGAVVYVAGAMRSGTTILGQVVAASPAALLVGELRSGIIDPEIHQYCDCDRARAECPYWSRVDVAQPAADVARRATSLRAIPGLVRALLTHRPPDADAQAVIAYLRVARAAAGDAVVVDTSKTPTVALLWRLSGAQVHVALAVRNPWKVAKAQARPRDETGLPQQPVGHSLAVWAAYEAGTLAVLPWAATRSVVGFAHLLTRPLVAARRVWGRATLPEPPDAGRGGSFEFGVNHVLSGNPRRSRDGKVVIRPR